MLATPLQLGVVALALLAANCNGRVLSRATGPPLASGSWPDVDTPTCLGICAPGSCKASACSNPLAARAVLVKEPRNSSLSFAFDEGDVHSRSLEKRVLYPLTQDWLAAYLPDQLNPGGDFKEVNHGLYDAYFGPPDPLYRFSNGQGTLDTVTVQREFGSTAFQIGTGELCGCTVITVVSKRAVFMGHFWEQLWRTPAYGQNAIYNWLAGLTPTTVIIPGQPEPVGGYGDAFNPGLFNQIDDATRIFIMTPLQLDLNSVDDESGMVDAGTGPAYSGAIDSVKNMLANRCGVDPNDANRVFQYEYSRLLYSAAVDLAQRYVNQRGNALFQFDPNYDGTATANNPKFGWRLFYEQEVYEGLPATGQFNMGT